jgi:hypothetical protein
MQMEPILICGIVFSALIAFIKILSDNRIRRLLIEKGLVDENVKFLYTGRIEGYAPASLKWGMVLLGIGLAFLIGVLVPNLKEATVVACIFIFGGAGLIIYYFYARSLMNKAENR